MNMQIYTGHGRQSLQMRDQTSVSQLEFALAF